MKASRAAMMLLGSAIACTHAPHSAPVDPLVVQSKGATPASVARRTTSGNVESDAGREPDARSTVVSPSAALQLGRSTFRFGLALHQALARDRGWAARNVVISPCSLSAAFAMVHAGAKGETAREIATTLRYDLDEPELQVAWAKLHAELSGLDTPKSTGAPAEFTMADSLWAQSGFEFAPAYRAVVADRYAAAVDNVDFARAPEDARGRINRWVKERTQGLVPELFPGGSLTGSTPLVVVNTAHFRAVWEEPFARSETRSEIFEKLDGRRTEVPTMHGTLHVGYIETSDYQAAQLRYVGDRLSMIVILPARGKFATVEQGLNAPALLGLVASLALVRRQVRVSIPKLTISAPFSLATPLTQLGMKRAFGAGADFSGMVTSGAAALYLGQVRHHVHLSVDEEQTEAAAATGVVVSYGAAFEQAVLRVDRPFLLGIHDRKTDLLLFWGRVVDPGAGG